MKSPESLVAKPEVAYGLLFALCNKWRLREVFSLQRYYFSSGQDVFRPINQSITLFKRQWYLTKGKSLYYLERQDDLRQRQEIDDIVEIDCVMTQIMAAEETTRNFSTTNLSSFIFIFLSFGNMNAAPHNHQVLKN